MKNYTDLEQSKKLAEILALESADMYYFLDPTPAGNIYHLTEQRVDVGIKNFPHYDEGDIPCWTVGAIIELLPYDIKGYNLAIYKSYCKNEKNFAYELYYEGDFYDYELSTLASASSIELIDACVKMIMKLKEKNLL